MRLTAADKREVIRLVEESDLPVRRTLRELQVSRTTFYRWYRRYRAEGLEGLTPRSSTGQRYWNRIPPDIRERVVELALAVPERTPRELAWQFTDRGGHFLSESSVYRILKAYDLITSPAFVVLTAGKTFPRPTHRPNELWQTDFTYLHVVGWGWYYLSTVLDDYSRYTLAWTLHTSMGATDVIETLDLARAAAGLKRVPVVHRPRLLSDNGPCYLSGQLATYLTTHGLAHTRSASMHPLVGAVLLRTCWRDALMHDAKLYPPDVQRRQAVNARRGERRAVVGADSVRQTDLAEQSAEDRFGVDGLHGAQAVARQHPTAEVIGHGERIAVPPIARAKLALEVRGPDLIWTLRRDGRGAGMCPFVPPPMLVQQSAPLEDGVDRTARGPRAARVPGPQHPQQLLRAPAVLQTGGDDQLLLRVTRPMRAPLRRATPVGPPHAPVSLMPLEPLVPRGAGHTIPLAQLGHRPVSALQVVHKREPFLHYIPFHPGHPPGVNDVPGLVSTMFPVYTPMQPNLALESSRLTSVLTGHRGAAPSAGR